MTCAVTSSSVSEPRRASWADAFPAHAVVTVRKIAPVISVLVLIATSPFGRNPEKSEVLKSEMARLRQKARHLVHHNRVRSDYGKTSGHPWLLAFSLKRATPAGTVMKLLAAIRASMSVVSPPVQRPVARLQGGLLAGATQSPSAVHAPGRPM